MYQSNSWNSLLPTKGVEEENFIEWDELNYAKHAPCVNSVMEIISTLQWFTQCLRFTAQENISCTWAFSRHPSFEFCFIHQRFHCSLKVLALLKWTLHHWIQNPIFSASRKLKGFARNCLTSTMQRPARFNKRNVLITQMEKVVLGQPLIPDDITVAEGLLAKRREKNVPTLLATRYSTQWWFPGPYIK